MENKSYKRATLLHTVAKLMKKENCFSQINYARNGKDIFAI
jgi:hypothetical protein